MALLISSDHVSGNTSRARGIDNNSCFLKVGSLNCRGINDYYKRMSLFEYLKNTDLSIIFLQETKLKPENEYDYVNEWHNKRCFFNSCPGVKSGTAILLNDNSIKMTSNKFIDVEGRVIAVDVEYGGNIFHLVNTYGPNDYNQKIPFLDRLYCYLGTAKNIIWGGDHNIATNCRIDRIPVSLANDHGTGEFLQLCNTFDLKDNCRVLFPNQKFFTFRKGSSRSRIDKICSSSSIEIKHYGQTNTIFSDHELIFSTLFFQSNFLKGPGIWRNNIKYYSDEELIQILTLRWENSKNELSMISNLPKWWVDTKYKLKLAFIDFSKRKAALRRRSWQMMDQGLYNITLALNCDPEDRNLQKEYNTIKKKVVKTMVLKSMTSKTFYMWQKLFIEIFFQGKLLTKMLLICF